MDNKENPLLLVGAGSIGERHIGILQKLGYTNINVYRQRNLPLRNIGADTVHIFTNWNEVNAIKPVAAFICTPTSQHLIQAIDCASKGIHLLVEKPLASGTSGLEDLKNIIEDKNVYLQVAYMLRFHPLMQKIKEIIATNIYGDLLNFQTYWGEYLPHWHPWEDYRKSYAAQKELGGGAALTLSHDIDLAIWLADSEISNYSTIKNYRSSLEVNVESGADINLSFKNGITGHCHVNFFEKSPKRNYRFVFENASVEIDYFKNELNILSGNNVETIQAGNFDRNNMFKEQCKYFMNKIYDFSVDESLKQVNQSEEIINICR